MDGDIQDRGEKEGGRERKKRERDRANTHFTY